MGAETLGLAISNIQDYSTARGAAGALFDIIDMVNYLYLHVWLLFKLWAQVVYLIYVVTSDHEFQGLVPKAKGIARDACVRLTMLRDLLYVPFAYIEC